MKILDGGLLTSVQDLGRVGHQRHGVAPGGALDTVALRCANALVGNDQGRAGLEITVMGPVIEFDHDALIAICGADLSPSIADVPLPTWEPVWVKRGAVLRFGEAVWGCRAYVAVAGGVDVDLVLGSRSTYLSAGFGGLDGRRLEAGDVLGVGPFPTTARRGIDVTGDEGPLPFARTGVPALTGAEGLYGPGPIRFVAGPDYDVLDDAAKEILRSATFHVSSESDRVGYRLEGPAFTPVGRREIPSAAVVTGAIQLPGGGQPVVLMAERQTTGGYPVIAVLATADLPPVAQLCPGAALRLTEVTVQDALTALRERESKLDAILRQVGDANAG
jgi:antagonist of KipI